LDFAEGERKKKNQKTMSKEKLRNITGNSTVGRGAAH